MTEKPIVLAMTGASGAPYGLRLLETLVAAGRRVYLLVSRPAQVVLGLETDLALPSRPAEMERFFRDRFGAGRGQLAVFGQDQWTAPVASGSALVGPMVVCPCSTSTLAAIATGASNTLLERAADVALKEQRKLLLVVRETPLSAIHLEHMLSLARMGAVVMPANPGFYMRPRRVEDVVDFMVARILDHLGIAQDLLPPWGRHADQA